MIFSHVSFVFLYHGLPTPSGVELAALSSQLQVFEAESCFPTTTRGQNRVQTHKTSYNFIVIECNPILPLFELHFLSSSEELHVSAFHFQLESVVIIHAYFYLDYNTMACSVLY